MLRIIDHDAVRELRLDRPPANALTPDLLRTLDAAVDEAPESGARGLVLSGAPGMFSAGLDVPHFLELDRAQLGAAWRALFRVMHSLIASPIPVAAALAGHAPAGGCVLALACERRFMAQGNYRIGLNEVAVGVPIPLPILATAEHVVGTRRAEEMCTSAKLYTGEEALGLGLVDELVPEEEVLPRALEWTNGLLLLPPETLRKTRALCHRARLRSFRSMDEDQLELFLDDWFGAESQAALGALVKRLEEEKS